MSELPYTFEEYVYARGLVRMSSHCAGVARVAFFSLAREDAMVVFSDNEWSRLLPADIDVSERRHTFAKLSALKPKLPRISSVVDRVTRPSSALGTAGRKRVRHEEPIEDIPAPKKTKVAGSAITIAENKPRSKFQPPCAGKGVQIPIMNGHQLPSNVLQAKKASTLRREFLEHRFRGVARRVRKRKDTVADAHLLPEFFTIAEGDEEAVRCACGCTKDDKDPMIQCDTCRVWQHTECMVDAVPKDTKEDYFCHQCDPWTHRKLIAQLRRDSEFQL
ncbi:hypothetical protein AMS68_003232 [Peltaster fructicola]|uniref:Zinc finger PHD-type domain-containing protein n=1 Tax=Peltaster fructicola TaxID=286661 RepID=A0A6H0XSU0_9PEZI|nr:hypothetical protein AMS68_003232 [Peltaster fructicola]